MRGEWAWPLRRDLEVTYLAAVGTIPEDHVEALAAGRKSSQPLEEEEVKLRHLNSRLNASSSSATNIHRGQSTGIETTLRTFEPWKS